MSSPTKRVYVQRLHVQQLTYHSNTQLFIVGETIHSEEGTTQGDPLTVSMYRVSEDAGEVTLYISIDIPGAVNYTLLVYLSSGTAEGKYIPIVGRGSTACPKLCSSLLAVGGVPYQSGVYNVTAVAEQTSAEVSIAIFDDSRWHCLCGDTGQW